MEELANLSNPRECWQEQTDGTRHRFWCKDCQDEGKEWLTPEPCEHILTAKRRKTIPIKVATATLQKFMNESTAKTQPEPSGSPRPLYNEDTYHTPPSDASQP